MTTPATPYMNSVDDGQGDAYDPQTGQEYAYLSAWYTRGYTASLGTDGQFVYTPLISIGPPDTDFAQFPADQNFTMITQRYFNPDADPIGGYLTFMPSDDITITESGITWRLPRRLSGTETWPELDSGTSPWAFSMEGSGAIYIWKGLLVVKLFATDNPNLTTFRGQPLTYHVIEHFLNGFEYDITVPTSTSVLDLNSLIVPGSIKPYRYDPIFPLGLMDDNLYEQLTGSPYSELPVQTQSSLETDFVTCTITATANNIVVDPDTDQIYFAFMQGGTLPSTDDWYEANWTPGGPPYQAQLLVGPDNDALLLANGQYQIWSKLVDYPQTIVDLIGILYIN